MPNLGVSHLMPITPFHFGLGAALHSASPRNVSFIAFCVVNVFVDIEPLYYMLTGQFPLHRFFHTYVGVTLVALGTVAIYAAMVKLSSALTLPNWLSWKQLSFRSVVIGAVLGGYSHILFDSIMHSDVQPLAPFTQNNPLWHVVSLHSLHWFCLGSGILGLTIVGIRRLTRR